jgi:3-isopropylmalate dehydrogenase
VAKGYDIAVIPGDGTGPEVIAEGLKVLKATAEKVGFNYRLSHHDYGGEHYLKTGEVLPPSAIEEFRHMDALYLGAIGHPDVQPGILEKGILLNLRFTLDQYINLRPVKLYPGVDTPLKHKGAHDIDFVVVRENTEGLYCGSGGFFKKGTTDEVAIQESINTRKGVERCIRYALEYCRKRNKAKKVTLCGKTNVLTYAFDLWERVFYEVGREYPDIALDYGHVDAVCMWMVKNPEWFDVIVTDNLFGDIITDLGAMIQGPMGGSAPKYAGKGVINPLAAIMACQMMLDFLGESEGANLVERAVSEVLAKNLKSLDAGKMGYSTAEIGDLVAQYVHTL